ncbi:MAG TPA: nitroreductase/quinone reductase family protein [Candidatus Thermoplasmatota archaeon]|nr:nitroreductase/quinone reductase family protein [Candidatus Thermoplasmatota archaeon]
MTAQAPPAARVRHAPPRALFRIVNPIIKALLRSPAGRGRMGDALALLTFTGRKTGRRYTTPVGYHRFPEEGHHVVYLFTGSPWKRNLRGGAPVALRIKGQDIPGHAVPIRDGAEHVRRVRTLLDRYGLKNARRLGLTLDPGHDPTEAELRAALRGHAAIRVTLDQPLS